jgi:anti-anti-sigma factor
MHESQIQSTTVAYTQPASQATAVITLRGEHDVSTNVELSAALQRACAQPRVLIDLTACAFADSTVLALLLSTHRRQARRGASLELVLPNQPHPFERITSLARVGTIMAVHQDARRRSRVIRARHAALFWTRNRHPARGSWLVWDNPCQQNSV